MSDVWQGPGYWIASDGKWYPPETHPSQTRAPAQLSPQPSTVGPRGEPQSAAPGSGAGSTPHPEQMTVSSWGGYGTATLQQPDYRLGQNADAFAVGPSSSGPKRRRVSRRVLAWGSVVLSALLVTGGALVAVSGQSTKWDPRILGIVRFDEQHRGLMFKQPVTVEFLDTAQFNKEVSVPEPTSKADKTAENRALGELRALGLVHGNVNLAQSENKLSQADVVGLYVDSKKTVFVRGTALTPYVRVTLAHELTHALQDQYFNLSKLRGSVKDGDDAALTALIEGDAVRNENLYEQSMSAADQQTYQREQSQLQKTSGPSANVPAILSDMLEFPYAFGPTFVDSLAAQGGTAAIDHAFRDLPVSEAQIADPVEYPVGWHPAKVAVPALRAGERRIDKPGPFGQVSLFEVLGSRLGYDQAWGAVQGWHGDNAVPYKAHSRTCMAIDEDMGTTTSATRLSDAARAWALSIPGATVAQNGKMVDIRSCDPGPSTAGPPAITPSAFDVLSARSGIIDDIMTSEKLDFAVGQCVTDGIIAGIGPSHYDELLASTLSPSQEAQLQRLAASSATDCRARGVA